MNIKFIVKDALFWEENIPVNNGVVQPYVDCINTYVNEASAVKNKGKIVINTSSKMAARIAYAVLMLLFRG
ncbi:MAG: hypothetical protein PHV37_01880 [Candidatus Gastranaerophilales bacterium]|nr:hypothetical protein [Candidatus Gastranaerophilales bacterium]